MTENTHQPLTPAYDDYGVVVHVQARPDGPSAPIRLTPEQVVGLTTGLALAVEAFQNHQKLVGSVDSIFTDGNETGSQ